MNEEERLLIGNLLCADADDESQRDGQKNVISGQSVAPAPGPIHAPTNDGVRTYWPEPPPPYSPPSGGHQSWLPHAPPPPPHVAHHVDVTQPPPNLRGPSSVLYQKMVEQNARSGQLWHQQQQRPSALPQGNVPDEPFVSAPSTPTQAHRAAMPQPMGAQLSALVQSLPVARVHHHHIHHVQHHNQPANPSGFEHLKQHGGVATSESISTTKDPSGLMQFFAVDAPPPNMQHMLNLDMNKACSKADVGGGGNQQQTGQQKGGVLISSAQRHESNNSSDSPPPADPVVLPRSGLSYRDALYRDEARENRTSSTTSATSVETEGRPLRPAAVSGATQPKRAASPPTQAKVPATNADGKWARASARRSSGSVGAERRAAVVAANAPAGNGKKSSKTAALSQLQQPLQQQQLQQQQVAGRRQNDKNKSDSSKKNGKRTGRSSTRTGQPVEATAIAAGRYEVLANEDVFGGADERADKNTKRDRSGAGGAGAGGLKAVATGSSSKSPDVACKADGAAGRGILWTIVSLLGLTGAEAGGGRAQGRRGNVATGAKAAGGSGAAAGGGRKNAQAPDDVVCALLRPIGCTVWLYLSMALKWLYLLIYDIGSSLYEILAHVAVEWAFTVWQFCLAARAALQQWGGRALASCKLALMSVIRWRPPWQRVAPVDRWAAGGEVTLQDNIELPATGEAAMRRLLAARGQDAYTILGVRADCSDETLKRYYKRQAVLVHPDKNDCAGADEAFKILCAAFEMVSTPDKRVKYNMENIKSKAMEELDELMAALAAKLEAALCAMPCECGRTHRRYATQRPVMEARYCNRCGCRHPARPNDLWAETRFFGFLWYYYACMDGQVYDITEWAGCSDNHLKHMKPNAHSVQYRLVGAARRNQPPGNNRQFSQSQVESFLNAAAAAAAAASAAQSRQSPAPDAGGTPTDARQHAGHAHQASYQPPPARGTAGRRRRK